MTDYEKLQLAVETLRSFDLPISPILEYSISEKLKELSCQVEPVTNNGKAVDSELSVVSPSVIMTKIETQSDEQAARRAHKFNSKIDASVEIFKLGSTYWMNVYNALMKEELLSYGDCDFIRGIASCISKGSLPSAAQCKRLLKIVEKAEDKGYLMP